MLAMTHSLSLPTMLVLVPAAGGIACMTVPGRKAAGLVSMLVALLQAALLVASAVTLHHDADVWHRLALSGQRTWIDFSSALGATGSTFPDVQYLVRIDAPSLGLAALVALVTTCAATFSWHVGRERPGVVHGLLWLTAAALTGLFFARDLMLFYLFFELMLVPMLLLVGGWGRPVGTREAPRIAMTMFIYTLVGSLLMLVGIIAVGTKAGTLQLDGLAAYSQQHAFPTWMALTFLLSFAIKAPLVPFHGWLADAYRSAPAEGAAVLSGLVSKAAAYGLLAVALPLFGHTLDGPWGTALIWVALGSLLYGSIAAFRQLDARGVLAYSSIAQMGLITLGFATYLGAGGQQGVAGGYLQSLNHGLISASMFLLVGIVELRAGTGVLARLGGIATGRPRFASIGLLLAMCALAVPGSNAFAGELLVAAGAFNADWSHAWIYGAIVGLAVVLAAMYSLRLVSAILHTPGRVSERDGEALQGASIDTGEDGGLRPVHGLDHPEGSSFGSDLRLRELAVLLPLVAGILLLSAWPDVAKRASNACPVPIEAKGSTLCTGSEFNVVPIVGRDKSSLPPKDLLAAPNGGDVVTDTSVAADSNYQGAN